ncbi:DegT/DnrJ/EryC1/StrS family aminotransferase, partial [Myxococcota bacterium]|nr:DegT/DnrJ/EryC1/StrS family aminotransferase [Myxococcota bacterium]
MSQGQARVRMVDLAARHAAVAEDVEARVLAVLRSGRYIGGPVVDEAEAALAAALGRRYAVGVGSGTDALAIALLAAGVRAGERVALPALSFFATAESVHMIGAEPVFVDVLPDRPLLDPTLVPDDVEIVVPVHLFGMRAEAPPDRRIIVTDAAQCLGWGHGAPGGLTSALSLYPTKTLGAAGDGGAVLTDDP